LTDLPDFHDGYVDGGFSSDSTVRILLRSVSGEEFTLVLDEVDALRVTDLMTGNIILELKLLMPDQLDPNFVFGIYEYSDEHKKKFVFQDWVEKATQWGMNALEITPSYGCCLLALFRNHTIVGGHIFG
jgi:hypothetical protein